MAVLNRRSFARRSRIYDMTIQLSRRNHAEGTMTSGDGGDSTSKRAGARRRVIPPGNKPNDLYRGPAALKNQNTM